MRRTSSFSILIAVLTLAMSAIAAVPQTVHYSGKLDTAGGAFTGTVDVTFALYVDAAATNGFWSDTQAVAVTNGRFHVQLGPLSASDVNVSALHVGIQVASDPEMARVVVSSVPFALRTIEAENAVSVGGLSVSELALVAHSHALADLEALVRRPWRTPVPRTGRLTSLLLVRPLLPACALWFGHYMGTRFGAG